MADMEELIKEEIARIPGLEERVAFKDLVEQVFLSLYEANRDMYRQLEQRVMDDLAVDINRCRICTGIVEREYLDASHHFLSPMKEADAITGRCDGKEAMEQLARQGRCHVQTLFLECDYVKLQKLFGKKHYSGRVRAGEKECAAEFTVVPNAGYLQEICHLYEVFTKNGISWQTVNAPYLYKFADIYLEGLPEGLEAWDAQMEFFPDLEEFTPFVRTGLVPLWNLKRLELDSVGFPVPCEDHKSFEHIISTRDYGSGHFYLIDDPDMVFHVRQRENRLFVMAEEPEGRKWDVYMIRNGQNRKFERFPHPLMKNIKRDDFTERFGQKQGITVRTPAELSRFIRSYGMEEYVQYQGYHIEDRGGNVAETYSMNPFILDEIRQPDWQKRLVLTFKGTGKEEFLLRDIMSFLVSEAQLLYREYQCEGRLV